jgi:uncharacterized protein YajQ (UPF0234 family)
MPSFDISSELDKHEATNAIDQANREISTRFDFKGIDARYTLENQTITLKAETDFHLQQMRDILNNKFVKREIDLRHMKINDPILQHKHATQTITLLEGIDQDSAKKIVKILKETKLKVQASIQGDKVRVTGKKRDDLQEAITFLKKQELNLPLQFGNFRD